MPELNVYMGYPRSVGSGEGACLIFAHTAREAKRLAWPEIVYDLGAEDFTNVAIKRLRDKEYLYSQGDQEKLARGEPHVIFAPTSCRECGYWTPPLNERGLCADCMEFENATEQDGH